MSVRLSRVKALRRFTVRAHLPDRLAALERLSINLRWSWDKPTQDLFAAIDPALAGAFDRVARAIVMRYDGDRALFRPFRATAIVWDRNPGRYPGLYCFGLSGRTSA